MKNDYQVVGDIVEMSMRRREGPSIVTIFSVVDLERADSFRGTWHATFNRTTDSFYVCASTQTDGRRKNIQFTSFLLDVPKGYEADHINHNTLDNRRENLRVVTHSENCQNRRVYRNASSPVRGVRWSEKYQKWQAEANLDGRTRYIGSFNHIKDAQAAVIRFRTENMPYTVEDQSLTGVPDLPPENDCPLLYKVRVGDFVTWDSQAHGFHKTKRGKVLGIVPPHASADNFDFVPRELLGYMKPISRVPRAVVDVEGVIYFPNVKIIQADGGEGA